jgi:outer membrane PBP1 activator LpoA protein
MLSSLINSITGMAAMRNNLLILCFALVSTLLASCSSQPVFENTIFSQSPSTPRDNSPISIENPAFWDGQPLTVWARVQQVPLNTLAANQSNANPIAAGWVRLAVISKRYSTDTPELTRELTTWRSLYANHPGNQIFPADATLTSLGSASPPKNIALLLPLQGKFAALGNAVRNGFLNGYYAQLAKTNYQQNISFIDTGSGQSIASLYQQAISKGADFVIGPLTKDEVTALISSGSFSAPTLALNYTDSWGSLPSNLYEFGLSPIDEAKQIADKAWSTGHTHALIIAPQTEWGRRAVKALSVKWLEDGGSISDTFYFSTTSNLTTDIATLLHVNTTQDTKMSREDNDKNSLEQQRRHDFDVIFLLAPPQTARQIVPLLRYYYVDKTAIFSPSLVYAGFPQPQKDFDLNGVTFTETPYILSGKASESNPEANRLFAVGHDAYFISQNISRFTVLPNMPLYGATGALTLNPQKKFYRRLAWAQIRNGRP